MASFELQIAEFAKRAGANADLVCKKVGIDVFASVVRRTPVDTGRARGNWVVSIGSPSSMISAALDPGDYGDDPGSSSAVKADAALADFQIGASIYIMNNLPYIKRLEDGYSTQTPPGVMVALTVVEFKDFVRDAVAKLNNV